MPVPVPVEYAVMIREEDQLVASGQRLGDRDISRPGRSAVGFQHDVLDVAIRQGVLQRARVIHNVHARERRGLVAHAVEQPKQALEVPLGADMARNDQCARHDASVYPRVHFGAGAKHCDPGAPNTARSKVRCRLCLCGPRHVLPTREMSDHGYNGVPGET